jgi:hypothetical protein
MVLKKCKDSEIQKFKNEGLAPGRECRILNLLFPGSFFERLTVARRQFLHDAKKEREKKFPL